MKFFTKMLAGAGLIAFFASTAQAATVTCPSGFSSTPLITRTITVTGALTGGLCYYKEGNFTGDDFSPPLSDPYTLIDKDITADPDNGQAEGQLRYTGSTSGNWSMFTNLWATYDTLYIAFHFGGGQGTPDSFLVQLERANQSGTWSFNKAAGDTTQLNGLSNIYLIGKGTCTTDCGTTEIPEPGSLALLGAGLAGLALIRRRRRD